MYDYDDDDFAEEVTTQSLQMVASAERCIVDAETLQYRPSFPISVGENAIKYHHLERLPKDCIELALLQQKQE